MLVQLVFNIVWHSSPDHPAGRHSPLAAQLRLGLRPVRRRPRRFDHRPRALAVGPHL